MIPKNTSKILLFLLKNISEYGFNINKISKLNNISVGSAFKILKELEQNDIVILNEINNASNYKLNFDSQETIKLCELLLMSEKRELKGYSKIYADDILKFQEAELIILFGSILKNESFNDVDVLFLSSDVKKIRKFCLDISKVRTKPVVPLILKKEDLIEELKNKKESLIEIVKNAIILKGESLFLEIIKDVYS